MRKVEIQGNEINNEDELHEFLKKQLEFPDYYGENLSALWDCLTDLLPEEVTIEWFDFAESRKKFGKYALGESVAEEFVSLFKRAEESDLMAGRFKLILHE